MAAASGHGPRLAVVGAAGAIGTQIAELIGERDFPYAELKLFGAEEGAAEGVETGGRTLAVTPLSAPAELKGFDLVFLAVPAIRAAEIIAARPGPILIDLSAAARAPSNIPVVAPGLTARERIHQLAGATLFAPPHPAAQVIATVLDAIGMRAGFAGATVILGASAGGREGVSELFNQSADLLNARLDIGEDTPQLAFNVFLPEHQRDLAAAIAAQSAALMGSAPALAVEVIQAPVFHSGAVMLFLPAANDMSEWPQRLRSAPGTILLPGREGAGLADAVGQEAVLVKMSASSAGAAIWCVFDSSRLLALSAVWIAETVTAAK